MGFDARFKLMNLQRAVEEDRLLDVTLHESEDEEHRDRTAQLPNQVRLVSGFLRRSFIATQRSCFVSPAAVAVSDFV